MGTVPDPVGSANPLEVASTGETDCLIEPQSTNCQHKQSITDQNANGVAVSEPMSAGLCLFEQNCSTSIEIPKCEQLCELSKYGKNQLVMSSPSPAEKVLLRDAELLSSCEPQWHSPRAEGGLAGDSSMVHVTDLLPSTPIAKQALQINQPHSSSTQQTDSSSMNTCSASNQASTEMLFHQHEDSSIKDEEPCDCSSQSNVLQTGQTEKPTAENISAPESPQSAVSVVACELISLHTVPQLTSNCHTNLETRARDETEALSCHVSDPTHDQETSVQSNVVVCQLIEKAPQEKSEPDPPKTSKYKDIGTMTNETKSCSSHDAEVQAVAHVESKSVSTSPSILAAYLREHSFQTKDREDQVCIIYRGSARQGYPEHMNSFPIHTEMSRNPVITPKVRFRATAMEVLSPNYLKLHGRPGLQAEAACKLSPNIAKVTYQRPDASSQPLVMYKGESEAQAICAARESHGLAPLPLAAPILMNVKPAYQINIENSNQTKPGQRPLEIKTQPPHFMASQEVNKRPGHHHVGGAESNQLHGNRAPEYDQPEMICAPADSGGERKPFHFKLTNELGSTQAIITTDLIKPKKEAKPAFLNFDGDITSNIGATGGQVEEFLQVFIRKEQDKLQEENEQAKRSSSLSLQSRSASDFSQNPAQHTPRLKKAREDKKEQKLAASATPDQPKLHPGKKLNQASSKAEEKGQGKESKSVKDVVWDEQGMTWEVYGASMDPESLGIAIQNHLTRQIREHEKLIRAQLKQNRKSISSDTSSRKKLKGRQNNVLQSILQNFRRPNCCAHPPPSSVLD